MNRIVYFDNLIIDYNDINSINFYLKSLLRFIINMSIVVLLTFMIYNNFLYHIQHFFLIYVIYFGIFHIINLSIYFDKYLNNKSKYYIVKEHQEKYIKYILILIYIYLSCSSGLLIIITGIDYLKKIYNNQSYNFIEYYKFFYLKFPYIVMSIMFNSYYVCEFEDINILYEFRSNFIQQDILKNKEFLQNLISRNHLIFLTLNNSKYEFKTFQDHLTHLINILIMNNSNYELKTYNIKNNSNYELKTYNIKNIEV